MAKFSLVRSRRHHMIAGVMGGIADTFGWNVNVLRVLFVTISCMSAAFPGILVYLVLWMLMPLENRTQMYQQSTYPNPHNMRDVN